jgi:hypothetical protein
MALFCAKTGKVVPINSTKTNKENNFLKSIEKVGNFTQI